IALTFDIERDIPNFLDTDFGLKIGIRKILNLLDGFQIKGTFFCTGAAVEQEPHIVELIESKEHEIACHSLNHERLIDLSFEECKEIISTNKKIIENRCQNSDIVGFRAPYLKPPKFIFKLLNDLGFKYDSSIRRKKFHSYHINNYDVQEFHPISIYALFRAPLVFYFIRKWIFRKNLSIIYFHSWEAVDIKSLVQKQKSRQNLIKSYYLRLDRWINTGDSFIIRIRKFIKEALSKDAEFVTLRQLLTQNSSIIK
ncbi:MAG: polysaccharide deacetylase family protein, partial [Promethearchaeota archaeon]